MFSVTQSVRKCFSVNVIKVVKMRSTPQHKIEVVRNATENSLVFSDKKMKKVTMRI